MINTVYIPVGNFFDINDIAHYQHKIFDIIAFAISNLPFVLARYILKFLPKQRSLYCIYISSLP